VFGLGRVRVVETWQLRFGLEETLTRSQARAIEPALRALLDRVANDVQT